ncbi:DUF547 domain-containing protein [Rubripirellula reticaptiva]|uniref:DUF547 domain-containing protein n=1 Tax=Rubripirellula reticaptiva TaxID=2528013 RepID=A0A5C6EHL9_9BACT|nr:DUF547 domain-containing protein [Rubripirellula reticaptiva]TWU46709.1 hypothetical protein Poly59_56820 [Rubripirellula reticaptiva]
MRKKTVLNVLVTLVIISASALFPQKMMAGSDVMLGVNVPPGQQVSIDQIDTSDWNRLLKRYVDDNGNVDYTAWKRSAADLQTLDQFLARLSTAKPEQQARPAAKLAFWINAYNAVTVRGILREYPTTSIRNHTAKLFGYNIWDDLLLTVGGKPYSLNEMEHEVLRKMNEPRIHFAIVCASRSCPRLLNEAYTADKLEAQLTANAKVFFRSPRGFQFSAEKKQFRLSAILNWFGEDFGYDQAAQLRTIAAYLPSRESRDAAIANTVSVSYLDYDWRLNDQESAGDAQK